MTTRCIAYDAALLTVCRPSLAVGAYGRFTDGLRRVSPNGAQVIAGAVPRYVSASFPPTDQSFEGATP